ncbi:MAG: WG repeat-containing protein [Ruminococcaceae bacterium]|nr:WG repeat-containing protein [Oscillospiraceae bacterium]
MNDFKTNPQLNEITQASTEQPIASTYSPSEADAINATPKVNKSKKSVGAMILVIILIIVLLAGNAVSVFLLTRKSKGNTLADIEFNKEFTDSLINSANMFDSEGLYIIEVDEKYGYINKSGSVVIKPQFDDAGRFSDGLATVGIDGKYGVIDNKGKYVISPQYDDIDYFSCGLCAVRVNDKYGYIDKTGKVIIPIIYREANTMSNDGYASVLTDNKERAIIDSKGKIIYSFDYSDNLCRESGCYKHVYDEDEYCYNHEPAEKCKWTGCDKEGTYGSGYCFNHYYALED